tara:strand:+ start:268 stop:894 length:627 start_codon:yes stop_codon:yes gene_type:complete
MSKKPNGYELSRAWFDFCFENPEKIKPNHTAVYFFAIEHCNRLAWKFKFGFPSTMAMEAIGIKSYNTYIKTLTDLVDWGFIKMVEKSKNQYSSNIISLGGALLKNNKALDKALIKHATKQSESTGESIVSINKQDNKEQDNNVTNPFKKWDINVFWENIVESSIDKGLTEKSVKDFYLYWTEADEKGKMRFQLEKTWDTKRRLARWSK